MSKQTDNKHLGKILTWIYYNGFTILIRVIALPPYWTPTAKGILRQACFECGLIQVSESDQLILCTEPEAVLLLNQHLGLELRQSEVVVVCDIGGSCTQLSAFKSLSGSKSIPFGPNGTVQNGSATIDETLIDDLKNRVGINVFREWCCKMPKFLSRVNSKFETLKKTFSEDLEYLNGSIRIPVCENEDVELFTHKQVQELFQDYTSTLMISINEYLQELERLNNHAHVKFIAVGGFAQSAYLLGMLQDLFQDRNISLIVQNPGAAIMQGAAILGSYQSLIRKRVYRYSYGTQFSKLFDPKTDDVNAYRWGQPPTEYIASFLPFTTAGKPIPEDQVFEQVVCPANDHQTEFPFGLYYSLDQSSNMSNCSELITITVAIPPAYRSLGKANRFRILMNFHLTEIKFSVIHLQSGQQHDSVVIL